MQPQFSDPPPNRAKEMMTKVAKMERETAQLVVVALLRSFCTEAEAEAPAVVEIMKAALKAAERQLKKEEHQAQRAKAQKAFEEKRNRHLYTLDQDGAPRFCEDVKEWEAWMAQAKETRNPHLFHRTKMYPFRIETTFHGWDRSLGALPPQVFETLIYEDDEPVEHHAYYMKFAEVQLGHQRLISHFRNMRDGG